MKLGEKNLILLAAFTSSAAWAGWYGEAWPTTNSFRAALNLVTNTYGQHRASVFSQSTGTNHAEIPQAYDSGHIVDVETNGFEFSYYGPLGRWTNGYARSITNESVDVFSPDSPTGTVAVTWTDTNAPATFRSITNIGGQFVTTDVTVTISGVQTNLGLNIHRMWDYDAYMATVERERVSDGDPSEYDHRNDTIQFRPSFRSPAEPGEGRANLAAIKAWIFANYGQFVDVGRATDIADDNEWNWTITVVESVDTNAYETDCGAGTPPSVTINTTTNSEWLTVNEWDDLPKWNLESFLVASDLPYEKRSHTNVYTTTVPGWFADDTQASNTTHTFSNVVDVITNTWFDWTPYRDLGGWRSHYSNRNDFVFTLTPWNDKLSGTNEIYDLCGNPYQEIRSHRLDSNSVVTQILYSIQHLYVTTNTDTITITGNVTITSGEADPHEDFIVTNVVTTTQTGETLTNFISLAQANTNTPGGWYTNVLYSTNAVRSTSPTNLGLECFIEEIAPGYSAADYGYKRMREVMSNLVWTSGSVEYSADTNSYPDIGYWSGFTCVVAQVDSAPFTQDNTDTSLKPFGFKIAYSIAGFSPSGGDKTINVCTNHAGCGPGHDSHGSFQYKTLGAGCYYVIQKNWYPGTLACESDIDYITYSDHSVTLNNAEDYLVSYELCCAPTNFPVIPYSYTKFERSVTKIPCEAAGGLDCVSIASNTFIYGYARQSMVTVWTADDPQFEYQGDLYYGATNPVEYAAPDNEPGFEGTLVDAVSLYTSKTYTNGGGWHLDFYSNSKPFGGNDLTNKGWEVEQKFFLNKWDVENGFEY